MSIPKFIILIATISFTLITLSQSPEKKSPSPKYKSNPSSNIDSLKIKIKSIGWDNSLLKNYGRYLTNSQIDFTQEIKDLKSYPYSFERTFLLSLIYKKQKNFREMYDSLYSQFKFSTEQLSKEINYFPYYDELVFAASASNLLTVLESNLSSLKKNSVYRDYFMAVIYYSMGKYKNSLELIKDWYSKDSSNFYLVYQLSYVYRNLGDYNKASNILSNYKKSVGDIDNWEKAKILLAEGSLFFLSEKNKEALDLYQMGYKLSLELNDLEEESRALVNLGIIADVNGEIGKSRKDFLDAINVAKKINDIDAEALAFSELGVSYSYTNELIKAKQNYEKSYKLYKEEGNQLRLSLLSYHLGKIYTQMFDYESGLKYYRMGVDFSNENKRALIFNLIGMADIYSNLSNYSKALQLYKEAQQVSKEIKTVSLDAQINYGLGALNFGLNKYQNALDYFKKSFRLNNQSDSYFSAQIFNQMAVVYTEMDSLKAAADYFNKAMKLSKINNDSYSEISSCIDLASLYVKENDLINAEKTLGMARKELANNDYNYLLARSYLIEGKILKAKKSFHDAQNSFNKAIELGEKINEFDTQIEAYYFLALLFEDNNLNEAAESYYNSAVRLIEDVSRPLFENEQVQISYYSSKDKIYNSFAEFYLKQNKYIQAFELIEKSRSRNTMHNLNNLKLESLVKNDSVLKKIYDYEWILHSNIYDEQEVNKVKIQFSQLKDQLVKNNQAVKKYLNDKQNFTLSDIQDNLSQDESYLSIYTSQNNSYLFLINKKKFYYFKIDITVQALQKMVGDISPYFARRNPDSSANFYNQDLFAFNAKAAYSLFEKLLKPAFDKISPGEKIIISASPELLTLPFEFLISKYNDSESAYNYSNKDFLVLNYNISYTPSAVIFIHQRQNVSSNNEKVLLVGDPLINNKINEYAERRGLLEEQGSLSREIPFLPLKYSGEEVREIGDIINTNKILTEKNATETNFKNNAGLNGIIHLSTHSFLFNKQPVIFFSNYYDPDNDGFLEVGEIVQLKLKSDLVVLSSCNSGLGAIDESEGILGMTKAFFEAGAKSVVVSLWTVNDKYTAKFMALFYKFLSEGFDKSEALRKAKIEFIKKYSPNPYYWAAFILSGNVSKLNIKTNFNPVPLITVIFLITLMPAVILYFRKHRNDKFSEASNLS